MGPDGPQEAGRTLNFKFRELGRPTAEVAGRRPEIFVLGYFTCSVEESRGKGRLGLGFTTLGRHSPVQKALGEPRLPGRDVEQQKLAETRRGGVFAAILQESPGRVGFCDSRGLLGRQTVAERPTSVRV